MDNSRVVHGLGWVGSWMGRKFVF